MMKKYGSATGARRLLFEEYDRLIRYELYLKNRLETDKGFPIEGYWKKRVEEVSVIIEQLKKHLEIEGGKKDVYTG